ncbi:hypothetical protein [Mycobacterium numidiamassiliense]|nr:hypothetical protein [Mycobacterium numidiamassiliense]
MTMKLRVKMSHKEAELEAKLAEHGLSVDEAQRVHDRLALILGGEASYFQNTKKLMGADPAATSLEYTSVLWPGFYFKAIASEDGPLESARYWHNSRELADVESPIGLPIWSMDVTEFAERFGPMNGGRKWSLFDELLPAYEEYEFQWGEDSYGAGFSWGLFMFSAMSWD